MLQIKMKLLGLFKTIFLPLYTAASMWFMNVIKKCWFAYFAPHPRIFYSCRDLTSGRSSVTNFDLSTVVKAVAVRDLYQIMWYGTLFFFLQGHIWKTHDFHFYCQVLGGRTVSTYQYVKCLRFDVASEPRIETRTSQLQSDLLHY